MTARRTSGRGAPQATWKDPRRRPELLKAIGAGAGVVVLTALAIFVMKPGGTSTPTQTPIQNFPTDTTPSTVPTGATGATGTGGATGTPAPSDSTGTTATTGAPSTISQP